MTMQVNSAAARTVANWEQLLSQVGDVQKTTSPDGKESLVLTMQVGSQTRTYDIGSPVDLALPENVDQAAIDSLCAKLEAGKDVFKLSDADIKSLRQALSTTLASVAPAATPNSKSVMFDLYRLMALLVEVAQKQRDASREQRLAESKAVQASILAQAAQQRMAAVTSMITSVACCAIQVGFSFAMLGKQANAYKQQSSTMQTSGVASARQGVDMLKTADTTAHAANQLADIRAEVGNKPSGVEGKTVEQNVQDGFADSRAALERLDAQKAQVQSAGEQLQMYEVLKANANDIQANQIPDAGPIKDAYTKFETYQQKVQETGMTVEEVDEFVTQRRDLGSLSQAKQVELLAKEHQIPALKQIGTKTSAELRADIGTAYDGKIAELKGTLQTGPGAIETARQDYRTALKADLQRFESEYNSALHEKAELKADATGEKIAEVDSKLAQAENNLKLARATAADKFAQEGITTDKERALDIETAHKTLGKAQEVRHDDAKFLEATRKIQKFEAYNNIVYAVGNVAQSAVQSLNALLQANATEKNAEQQKAQEDLDQTKDLFSQAQDLVNEVVKLMQAIGAAESQSMRDAIQA